MSGFDALELRPARFIGSAGIKVRCSCQLDCDSLEEIAWVIRLGEELINLQVCEGGHMVVENGRAANNHGLCRVLSLDAAAHLDPAQDRQIQIKQDDVERSARCEELNPFGTVGGLDDVVTFCTQELRDQRPQQPLVFNQEDPARPFGIHDVLLTLRTEPAGVVKRGDLTATTQRRPLESGRRYTTGTPGALTGVRADDAP
jgi:hypothetical protein